MGGRPGRAGRRARGADRRIAPNGSRSRSLAHRSRRASGAPGRPTPPPGGSGCRHAPRCPSAGGDRRPPRRIQTECRGGRPGSRAAYRPGGECGRRRWRRRRGAPPPRCAPAGATTRPRTPAPPAASGPRPRRATPPAVRSAWRSGWVSPMVWAQRRGSRSAPGDTAAGGGGWPRDAGHGRPGRQEGRAAARCRQRSMPRRCRPASRAIHHPLQGRGQRARAGQGVARAARPPHVVARRRDRARRRTTQRLTGRRNRGGANGCVERERHPERLPLLALHFGARKRHHGPARGVTYRHSCGRTPRRCQAWMGRWPGCQAHYPAGMFAEPLARASGARASPAARDAPESRRVGVGQVAYADLATLQANSLDLLPILGVRD